MDIIKYNKTLWIYCYGYFYSKKNSQINIINLFQG